MWEWRKRNRIDDATADLLKEEIGRVVLDTVRPLLDEQLRLLTSLREAMTQHTSQAGTASEALWLRLIDANEKLSLRFQELWVGQQDRRREQAKEARAAGVEKQRAQRAEQRAEKVAQQPQAPPAIPEAYRGCEECMATIEARPPRNTVDLLKHAAHKNDFWTWLDARRSAVDYRLESDGRTSATASDRAS